MELKQRLQATSKKIKCYKQSRINRWFQQDQKKVYQQLNSKATNREKPGAKKRRCRSNIWGKEVKQNANAEWFKELKQEGACH